MVKKADAIAKHKRERTTMYRVLSNECFKHLQWIVVRDDSNGRPMMERGPFPDERTSQLPCKALNRERREPSQKSPLARFFALCRLIEAGWIGERPMMSFAKGTGMLALAARRMH